MENGIVKTKEGSLAAYAGNLDQAMRVGATLMKSGLIPQHFKSVESVVAAIWWGGELGFTTMQALQAMNVIQGKASVSAAGLAALVYQSGGTIKEVEHTDLVCKLTGTRGGNTREFEFSILDAERMGLAGKDNWKKMPKAMLYARCVSLLARSMFPDKVLGLYSTEEMQDAQDQAESDYKAKKKKGSTVVVETTATVVEAPKGEEPQAPSESKLFQYDISTVEPEKKPAAIKILKAHGATTEDELQVLWESQVQVERLAKFQVGAA